MKMESVSKARSRARQYPVILAKCSKEATVYAKCVLKKDNITKDDCIKEFKHFKNCLQTTASAMKMKL